MPSSDHAAHDLSGSLQELPLASGRKAILRARALEKAALGKICACRNRSLVLESVLRNATGSAVTNEHVRELAAWQHKGASSAEIPFVIARILLQDMAGYRAND